MHSLLKGCKMFSLSQFPSLANSISASNDFKCKGDYKLVTTRWDLYISNSKVNIRANQNSQKTATISNLHFITISWTLLIWLNISNCETQSHIEHWLSSSIFTCSFVRPSAWWHLHFSPLYDVLDHTNHIFSENLSSGDDNDWDEDSNLASV